MRVFDCAMAQSNVTMFGAIDMSLRSISNQDSGTSTSVGDQGNAASKLVFAAKRIWAAA